MTNPGTQHSANPAAAGIRSAWLLPAQSSNFMKSPLEQYPDDIARHKTEEFIKKYGKKAAKKAVSGTPVEA